MKPLFIGVLGVLACNVVSIVTCNVVSNVVSNVACNVVAYLGRFLTGRFWFIFVV